MKCRKPPKSNILLAAALMWVAAFSACADEIAVLCLHGHGGSGENFKQIIQPGGIPLFNAVWIFPTAADGWESGLDIGFRYKKKTTAKELRDLIFRKVPNPTAVYGIGHSAGGCMIYKMVKEYPGLFDGVMIISSTIGTNGYSINIEVSPPIVITAHGTADGTIPIDGGYITPFVYCHPYQEAENMFIKGKQLIQYQAVPGLEIKKYRDSFSVYQSMVFEGGHKWPKVYTLFLSTLLFQSVCAEPVKQQLRRKQP